MLDQSVLITGCHRQVRQKIANVTGKAKKWRVRRSVDRMSAENRNLREAEVQKRNVEDPFSSQVKLISNDKCKKKYEGIYKIHHTHICGFTPGSFFTFGLFLYSFKVWTLVKGTPGDLLVF